jgi:ubiquinone/menaquinone biosynthesis C-methylase UbiE
MLKNDEKPKGYKGIAMEGPIARWYAKNTSVNMNEYKNWAGLVAKNTVKGGRVLEVAPGPGYLSIELAKTGDYQVTGLDISRTFVEIEQANARKAGVSAEFRQGDVAYMPFDDGTFDFIICTAAFKNFTQPVKALAEMKRGLKVNGKALIIDLRRDANIHEINGYVKNMGMSPINALFTKFIFRFLLRTAHTIDEMRSYASSAGFKKIEARKSPIEFELWLERS